MEDGNDAIFDVVDCFFGEIFEVDLLVNYGKDARPNKERVEENLHLVRVVVYKINFVKI